MLCGRKGWKKVESRSWAPAGSARNLAPGKQAWPAPNLPPGKGVKSGLAFPGLFWYNHKESAEPLPSAAESGLEWRGNTMGIYKIGLDKGAAALIIRQTDRQDKSVLFCCVTFDPHISAKGAFRSRTFRGRDAPFFCAPRPGGAGRGVGP